MVEPSGFGGDLEARALSWQKGILSHGSTEEVPRRSDDRAVRIALESERPIAHVAHDFGMHPETLRKKVRQAEDDTARGANYRPEPALTLCSHPASFTADAARPTGSPHHSAGCRCTRCHRSIADRPDRA